VESSLALLFDTRDEAASDGIREPVVFLVDCEDAMGGEMARAWAGNDAVDDAVGLQLFARDGDVETTVLARAVDWETCSRETPAIFPYLAPLFDASPPTDGFLTVVVTSGGAVAFTVPFDARPNQPG
jgi:hypothetical protein